MNKTERELWQKYSEALARKKQLEEFLKNLRKPKETEKAAVKAYEEVVVGVQAKISSLSTAAVMMKKSVEEISQRLDSPECRNNILLVTPQILRANTQAKKMLKRASEDLEKTHEAKFALQRRIISPQRALAMAQNIFVGGEFKRLRAAFRQFKKDEQRLAKNVTEYVQREKIFNDRDWTLEPCSKFLQEQYYLTRQRKMLELEKIRLDRLRLSLENRQTELEKICQEAEAQAKIEIIAADILRKNYKFTRQLRK